MYALRCLAYTTPGTIEANTFWDQATRYAGVFVKTTPQKGEEQTTSMILHGYAQLVDLAEQRSDREMFMSIEQEGKGFLGLCEHWLSFAKRVNSSCMFENQPSFAYQMWTGWRYLCDSEDQLAHETTLVIHALPAKI